MTNLQGVIFDMDGLLFDTEMLYYQATQVVADEMELPYTKDIYLQYVGISDEEVWAAYHELYDPVFGKNQVDHFIQTAFDKTLEMFEQGEAQLKPGVIELLDYLEEQTIPYALASSNQRMVIDRLLQASELDKRFSTIVCFDDVARAKPDPEIFLKAHQRLAIPKKNLVIFEDSANGIRAAHAAKIPVIMVPDLIAPDKELISKEQVLNSLLEAPEYLTKNFLFV